MLCSLNVWKRRQSLNNEAKGITEHCAGIVSTELTAAESVTSCEICFFCVLRIRPTQHVEFFIDRGVLGVNKEATHTVLEYRGDQVQPHTRHKFDSSNSLVVPVMPPTLVGVCRLLQMYYVLKVGP
ncbi:hypothetical protein MRX96_023796 [Rhipicephalus microplus]